jgi:hypothetical protein
MQDCLTLNGRKINNCLMGSVSGINSLSSCSMNQSGFYFLGKNPCAPFDESKAFHIAFFDGGRWNYFKPNDGFVTFSLENKKIYIYSSRKGWTLI